MRRSLFEGGDFGETLRDVKTQRPVAGINCALGASGAICCLTWIQKAALNREITRSDDDLGESSASKNSIARWTGVKFATSTCNASSPRIQVVNLNKPNPNDAADRPSSEPDFSENLKQYRPFLIVLFAMMVLIFASQAKGQSNWSSQFTSQSIADQIAASGHSILVKDEQPVAAKLSRPQASTQSDARVGGGLTTVQIDDQVFPARVAATPRSTSPSGKVKFVEVSGAVANWDADSDPDGWDATVVVRNANDQIIRPKGRVEFELMPRYAAQDYQSFRDARRTPIRWAKDDLRYSGDGASYAHLELRSDLKPVFGWDGAEIRQTGSRSTIVNDRARPLANRLSGKSQTGGRLTGGGIPRRAGSTIGGNWRDSIPLPRYGELRVKVSIPGQGVFKATSEVEIRPSILVDTKWPYR